MKNTRIRWYGPKVQKKVEMAADKRLDKAAEFLRGHIVSVFPPGPSPAPAGLVPHVQTGHLKRNVNWKRSGNLKRAVGTGIGNASSVGYAAMLEFGTVKMAPRPFLRPALKRSRVRKRIAKITGSKLI